jgi:AbrB family looped-hinge helix DNA binding protein
MTSIATTRMSSKGQVVIPEEIRTSMKLNPGEQFVVLGEKDVIILKTVTPPSLTEFDELIQTARKQARKAGLKKSDVAKIIKKARSNT